MVPNLTHFEKKLRWCGPKFNALWKFYSKCVNFLKCVATLNYYYIFQRLFDLFYKDFVISDSGSLWHHTLHPQQQTCLNVQWEAHWFEPRLGQILVLKTGSDSSTSKRSATSVSFKLLISFWSKQLKELNSSVTHLYKILGQNINVQFNLWVNIHQSQFRESFLAQPC